MKRKLLVWMTTAGLLALPGCVQRLLTVWEQGPPSYITVDNGEVHWED